MKKLIALILVLILGMSVLGGCTGGGGGGASSLPGGSAAVSSAAGSTASGTNAVPIKVANYFAENHPINIALEEVFKTIIEEKTEGRYVVELYPNNILGAEKEFVEAVKLGTVEVGIAGVILSEQFPKLKVINFPWVFDDLEKAYKVLNDPEISMEVYDGIDSVGIIGRGMVVNGVRATSNSKRPINTLADCQGLKMRFPEVQHFVDGGKALGFNVVTMSMSEIFTALQQGVIDGQENPPTTLLTSGWYEVQEHLAITKHQISFDWIAVSSKFYNAMSAEDQAVFDEACAAYRDAELKMYMEAEERDIKELESRGVKVTYPDRTAFKEAGEKVIQDYCEKYPEFDAILKAIRAKEAAIS